MTLWFDLSVLEKETKGDPQYLVEALKLYYNKIFIPKSQKTKYKPITKPLKGSSFLLNPEDFFNDTGTDVLYRAQYIKLAARRDYFLYKTYDIKYLDLTYFSDLNINVLKSNPLLEINKQQIKFKYEEN